MVGSCPRQMLSSRRGGGWGVGDTSVSEAGSGLAVDAAIGVAVPYSGKQDERVRAMNTIPHKTMFIRFNISSSPYIFFYNIIG